MLPSVNPLLTLNDSDPAPRLTTPRPSDLGCELQLQNPCRYSEASARRIRPWLTPVVDDLAPSAGGVTIRFVSDREMRRISREFRGKDASTDVLSFTGDFDPTSSNGERSNAEDGHDEHDLFAPPALDGLDAAEGPYLGDIVVSVPTARRQAEQRGHSVEQELKILLLHGLLHCLGYDHETDDGTMELLEAELRLKYGISAGAEG